MSPHPCFVLHPCRAVPDLDDPSLQADSLHSMTLKATMAIHSLIPFQPLPELLPKCDTSDCHHAVAMRSPQIYGVRPPFFFFSPGFLLFTCMHSDSCVKSHTVSICWSIVFWGFFFIGSSRSCSWEPVFNVNLLKISK